MAKFKDFYKKGRRSLRGFRNEEEEKAFLDTLKAEEQKLLQQKNKNRMRNIKKAAKQKARARVEKGSFKSKAFTVMDKTGSFAEDALDILDVQHRPDKKKKKNVAEDADDFFKDLLR